MTRAMATPALRADEPYRIDQPRARRDIERAGGELLQHAGRGGHEDDVRLDAVLGVEALASAIEAGQVKALKPPTTPTEIFSAARAGADASAARQQTMTSAIFRFMAFPP